MKDMQAIVLNAFGDCNQLKLKKVPIPTPKKGEIRIKIKAIGFNPVDFKLRKGKYPTILPQILGADCSGIVDEIGPDCKKFSRGDEVYTMIFGQGSNGSYAEYTCIPEIFVEKKPDSLSFEQAAAVPLAAMTAYRAMIQSSAIKQGDNIFIAGASGGVGSFAVQFAKFIGVKNIFTLARDEKSASFIQSTFDFEPSHILLYDDLDILQMEEKLFLMNNLSLFDATFDFIGEHMKQLCLNLTRQSGHFATILSETNEFPIPVWQSGLCFSRSLSIHLIFVGAESHTDAPHLWHIYGTQLQHISNLFQNNILKPPPVTILGTLSEKSVKEAHSLLETKRVKGKLVALVD